MDLRADAVDGSGREPDIEVDVVVVGGGPAGAATAISCASGGLRVALLERRATPLERPGESLHPGIEPLLARLGAGERFLAAGFPRHAGRWVTWGWSERRFVPFGSDGSGPWSGFQAHRAALDGLLLDRAAEAGAQVHRPVPQVTPLTRGGRVVGVDLGGIAVRAGVVVDAGGGRHWLARHLGLAVEERSPRLVARYGYADGACPGLDEAPEIVADDHGWTWTAGVGQGRYHWTRLALDGRPTSNAPPEQLAGMRVGRTRSADVTWRVVRDCAGPGWFAVGDAACVLDPAASHGVLRAVMSGMQAANLILRAAGGEIDEPQGARSYRDWLVRWYSSDEAALCSFYAELPSPPPWIEGLSGKSVSATARTPAY